MMNCNICRIKITMENIGYAIHTIDGFLNARCKGCYKRVKNYSHK